MSCIPNRSSFGNDRVSWCGLLVIQLKMSNVCDLSSYAKFDVQLKSSSARIPFSSSLLADFIDRK